MSNEFKNIKIIAEEAAKHSNCLITDVLVSILARHMEQTSNDILAYLNSIDDGTVEKAESDIKIEFSLGAKPPQSTI